MGSVLSFFLFIIIFVVLLILFLGLSLLRNILGLFSKKNQSSRHRGRNPFFGEEEEQSNSSAKNPNEKVFRKDEGEYVDFEEFKE